MNVKIDGILYTAPLPLWSCGLFPLDPGAFVGRNAFALIHRHWWRALPLFHILFLLKLFPDCSATFSQRGMSVSLECNLGGVMSAHLAQTNFYLQIPLIITMHCAKLRHSV